MCFNKGVLGNVHEVSKYIYECFKEYLKKVSRMPQGIFKDIFK